MVNEVAAIVEESCSKGSSHVTRDKVWLKLKVLKFGYRARFRGILVKV